MCPLPKSLTTLNLPLFRQISSLKTKRPERREKAIGPLDPKGNKLNPFHRQNVSLLKTATGRLLKRIGKHLPNPFSGPVPHRKILTLPKVKDQLAEPKQGQINPLDRMIELITA